MMDESHGENDEKKAPNDIVPMISDRIVSAVWFP
jgi:hypothetical protein